MIETIKIELSNSNTSDSVIEKLMEIERDVYLPEHRGEYHSIKSRFDKYKDMFVLAYDKDKIIGYLCFFPISNSLHDAILSGFKFYDDDISPNDVVKIGEHNYIYLISIAMYKKYQGVGIGKLLMDAFFNKLKLEEENGHYTDDILASVISQRGEQIARKYKFSMIKDLSETQHYKLFYLSGEDL